MLLSAGYGERLKPLTDSCPKPLLKINEETLLSNTINFLSQIGVKHVVINVHYLADQIINYINKKKFNLTITVIQEKEKILDTGGGILNAIDCFSNQPFFVINPDTIWNKDYISEAKTMENDFLLKNQKCSMLIVNKKKSFDKKFKGDFNIKKNLVNKKNDKELNYIYTGLQIIKPEVFLGIKDKIFRMNKVWDNLIEKNELHAKESNVNFFHVSTLKVYKDLLKKFKY